ncbi:subclass B3 metallo-beta-lactamase [Sphingomonas aerophila]|jgi:metallo-beta-lactamase class B|uniref:Metallo-beta-lactamase class B n=1 Tax=Sphingomonas aerophila TaxID=1344948 RepID=A0A7W9BFH2_9SPHN|nr:subclass B3 metallo-beta-lactamase [Sphingomonas aerophila]MBB5716083.1 metallo-beta-lactamase class B [Sphingomonas aerophila]
MSASAALFLAAATGGVDGPALAAACRGKDGWTDPAPPARVYGNTYDVGTCGIVALLVTSPKGHILIDGGPAEAAPLVAANIERLGFRLRDVRYLMNTHEHHDHAGGLAELQRRTGATLVARAPAKKALETGRGEPADPQFTILERYPGARVGRVIGDGGRVTLGGLVLTAHATPGHAPGSTSWTWRSCEAGRCVTVTYADSISSISSDEYRFAAHPALVATFRATMAKVAALPCDLLVTPHPAASHFYERLARTEPLIDPAGCRRYAERGRQALDARLAKEEKR